MWVARFLLLIAVFRKPFNTQNYGHQDLFLGGLLFLLGHLGHGQHCLSLASLTFCNNFIPPSLTSTNYQVKLEMVYFV